MTLYKSFREELIEHIQDSDPALYKDCGKTKEEVLADHNLLNCMWIIYQKDIEEHGMEAPNAFRDALKDVLGIPAAD